MPRVSLEQSDREISSLWDRANDARRPLDFAGALPAHQELLDHPCAHHAVDTAEVHEERHLMFAGSAPLR